VNTLSHMYEQWVSAGSPLDFQWQPENVCPLNSNFKVDEFGFGNLIWSRFAYKNAFGAEVTVTEPFGCIAQSKTEGDLYLVFRGSKSAADFLVDVETGPASYMAPLLTSLPNIEVAKGWYSVYEGLRERLVSDLRKIGGGSQLITITGHSLGSTLATLAVPDAVANGLQVRHYNSASPKVGHLSFKLYYDSLKVRLENPYDPGWIETFRLVNNADTVPKFPESLAFVDVGTQVSFDADYGSERKTHDPCCSYAYALYNPDQPFNPEYDMCAAETSSNILLSHLNNEINK